MLTSLFLLLLLATTPPGQPPPDKPMSANAAQDRKLQAAIAPYITEARKSWPAARDRYLKGLPRGYHFAVTVDLVDPDKKHEMSFCEVKTVVGDRISCRIANDLNLVRTFRRRQEINVQEAQILDWTIVRPDGTEEGNVVGKFLDTYQP